MRLPGCLGLVGNAGVNTEKPERNQEAPPPGGFTLLALAAVRLVTLRREKTRFPATPPSPFPRKSDTPNHPPPQEWVSPGWCSDVGGNADHASEPLRCLEIDARFSPRRLSGIPQSSSFGKILRARVCPSNRNRSGGPLIKPGWDRREIPAEENWLARRPRRRRRAN